MMVTRVVEENMDECQHRTERFDRLEQSGPFGRIQIAPFDKGPWDSPGSRRILMGYMNGSCPHAELA